MRSAPSTRSSAAPMTPTACWACLLALLMRGAIVPITAPAPAITATVTPSSTGSTQPHHHDRRHQGEATGAQTDQ
ncbi:hypothetical protein SVIOM74S_02301 [Streptomyces violarus]